MTAHQDPELAEIFGTNPAAYQRGIDHIVQRALEVAVKDKWPLKAALAPARPARPRAKKATR